MRHVADFDVDKEFEEQRITAGHLQVRNVAAIVSNNRGDSRKRARRILHPHQNARDVEELPEDVRNGITFHPMKTMDEVLGLALVNTDYAAEIPAVAPH